MEELVALEEELRQCNDAMRRCINLCNNFDFVIDENKDRASAAEHTLALVKDILQGVVV